MTLIELFNIANSGYPEDYLREYYDDNGNKKEGSGDTLAEFIVGQLIEVYWDELAKKTDAEQLSRAIRVLDLARDDLDGVIEILQRRLVEIEESETQTRKEGASQ